MYVHTYTVVIFRNFPFYRIIVLYSCSGYICICIDDWTQVTFVQ